MKRQQSGRQKAYIFMVDSASILWAEWGNTGQVGLNDGVARHDNGILLL